MSDPEEQLAEVLNACPEMREVFVRRAIRMILGTEVKLEDERRFNEWRISQGLKALDENNHVIDAEDGE